MSGFQLEAEAFISVQLKFTHPRGSVSSYEQDFNLNCTVRQLKEDMQQKLSVPAEQQTWTHKGQELQDSQTLMDAAVDDDDTVEVICRPK
ncbi:hypothetical protein BaRGS_00011475 [Batillaria attramentaria]|uniref:Ubiquitin-like domain-containing protein n=1 Tax=Batillaria attramentaria TaxID=370345 RepID=A0ABD0LCU8_9CAEN